jgi:hypothetical protein
VPDLHRAIVYCSSVSKGYAEGPVLEERLAELERSQRENGKPRTRLRAAVFGSTADDPESHFLGWVDEVDADELFASGAAFGITLRKISA